MSLVNLYGYWITFEGNPYGIFQIGNKSYNTNEYMNIEFSANKTIILIIKTFFSSLNVPIFYDIFVEQTNHDSTLPLPLSYSVCTLILNTLGSITGYQNCNFRQPLPNLYLAYNNKNEDTSVNWLFGPQEINECYSSTDLFINVRSLNANQSFTFTITDIATYNNITISNIYNTNTATVSITYNSFTYVSNPISPNNSITISYNSDNGFITS